MTNPPWIRAGKILTEPAVSVYESPLVVVFQRFEGVSWGIGLSLTRVFSQANMEVNRERETSRCRQGGSEWMAGLTLSPWHLNVLQIFHFALLD
jgi:hypothetical protein